MIYFVVVMVFADIRIGGLSSINQKRKIKYLASLVCVKVRHILSMYQNFLCRSMGWKPTDKPLHRDIKLLKLILIKCAFVMWIGCN
jgi:hypothetical protein